MNKLKTGVFLAIIGLLLTLTVFHVSTILADETTETNIDLKETPSSTSTPEEVSIEQLLNQPQTEKHQFQAEINQLLGILINSLYSNKEIFLRELISNASDALNKIRFMSLTDKTALDTGANLEIRIWADQKRGLLKIRDTGVGMTKQDLLKNLGTIANSGTKAFIEKLQKDAANQFDASLIGQFGVGFYSAYLVADRVIVTTKHNDDKQLIWTSTADNTFSIIEDPNGDTLKRGTEITLILKDDAKEFADANKLKELIKKYSAFIHFPIYLHEVRTVTEEVPVEETTTEEKPTEEKKEETVEEEKKDEEVEVEKKEETKEEKPKTKTIEKQVEEWNIINENKPLWLRSASNITKEEYIQFYKALTNSLEDPLFWELFSAEGQIDFKSLLYIPSKAPSNLFDVTQKTNNIKLYVKRVFITDNIADDLLLPRYLNFIKGLVDSEDLPLNVSREMLQHSKLLSLIKKKLLGKVIQMLGELADKDIEIRKNKKEENKDEEKKEEEENKFATLYKEFGKNIKLGVIEDSKHRDKLAAMLRFPTTKTEELISLDEYIERMKPKQEVIYFLAGTDLKELKNSPLLEELVKRDLEVLLMVDPIDEYMTGQLTEYKKKKLQNIAKEDLKFGDENEEDQKKREEEMNKEYEPLNTFIQSVLKDKISKSVVGKRISSSPCVLVASSFGVSANMARILKAQALGSDAAAMEWMLKMKVMEINVNHPIISSLHQRIKNDSNDSKAKEIVQILYDTAALRSGYDIDEKKDFADRIVRLISSDLGTSTIVETQPEETQTEVVQPEEVKSAEAPVENADSHDEL
ncbi:hypothetical protein ABK040_004683 [Willaertia magna]